MISHHAQFRAILFRVLSPGRRDIVSQYTTAARQRVSTILSFKGSMFYFQCCFYELSCVGYHYSNIHLKYFRTQTIKPVNRDILSDFCICKGEFSYRLYYPSGFELTGGGGVQPPSSPVHSIVTPQPPNFLVPAVLLTPQFIFHNSTPDNRHILMCFMRCEIFIDVFKLPSFCTKDCNCIIYNMEHMPFVFSIQSYIGYHANCDCRMSDVLGWRLLEPNRDGQPWWHKSRIDHRRIAEQPTLLWVCTVFELHLHHGLDKQVWDC